MSKIYIFELAVKELLREGKTEKNITGKNILDRAIKIRKWLDRHPKKFKVFMGEKNVNNKFEKHYYKSVI